MSVTVYRFRLSKGVLATMPMQERNLFIAAGHVLNELNYVGKVYLCSIRSVIGNEIEDIGSVTSSMIATKLMSGKLYEAWKLIQNGYLKTDLSRRNLVSTDRARECLDQLKNHFGKKSIINLIRTKYAFHYDAESINAYFSKAPEEGDWSIFLSESNGNCLYFLSELVANGGLFQEVNGRDHLKALQQVLNEIGLIWNLIADFLVECIKSITEQYSLVTELTPFEEYEIDAISIDSINLPFFTDSLIRAESK